MVIDQVGSENIEVGCRMKRFAIVVMIEGKTLKASSDGTKEGTYFEGDALHIKHAKYAIEIGSEINFVPSRRRVPVKAGYDSPLALTAALFARHPSYTRIWRAPKEVTQFIDQAADEEESLISVEDIGLRGK